MSHGLGLLAGVYFGRFSFQHPHLHFFVIKFCDIFDDTELFDL